MVTNPDFGLALGLANEFPRPQRPFHIRLCWLGWQLNGMESGAWLHTYLNGAEGPGDISRSSNVVQR